MPKILIACASSIATSTMVASVIRDELYDRGYEVNTIQCAFAQLGSKIDEIKPDLVLTTGKYNFDESAPPHLLATPILTGIGKEDLLQKIITILFEEKKEN